jgi:hypothetical protein
MTIIRKKLKTFNYWQHSSEPSIDEGSFLRGPATADNPSHTTTIQAWDHASSSW